MSRYVYLGDALTDPSLIGAACDAVRRPDGKCIVGKRLQLVRFTSGREATVLRRRLQVTEPLPAPQSYAANEQGEGGTG